MGPNEIVAWALENGAVIDQNISFKEISKGNYGAFYNRRSESNDAEIKIPEKLILRRQTALEYLKRHGFDDCGTLFEGTNVPLKLLLCLGRTAQYGSQIFHKPYLDMLPRVDILNVPYFWSKEQKECIKGTNLGSSLKDHMALILEEWWKAINLLPEAVSKPANHFINMKFYYEFKFHTDDDFYKYFVVDSANDVENWTSFPNYLWASCILKSRAFPTYLLKNEVQEEMTEDECMLLPIVDLLNHDVKSEVEWSATKDANSIVNFLFRSYSAQDGQQLFNNYGMKGNEELLMGYGFCLEDNAADTCALRIKVPKEIISEAQERGWKPPKLSDYSTSIFPNADKEETVTADEYDGIKNGLLFFLSQDHVPDSLLELFYFLLRNKFETDVTLRSKLAGLNQLRESIEAKNNLISTDLASKDIPNFKDINIYVSSQKSIYNSCVKSLKRLEKSILDNPSNKPRLLNLKKVYKRDIKLQHALLISLGLSSFEDILNSQFQDHYWILYLLRCYNRDEYAPDQDEDSFLPQWIQEAFYDFEKKNTLNETDLIRYKPLYDSLIPQLSKLVPEIFSKGKWGLYEMALSAEVLDSISFTRGKDKDCILVQPMK
ncbi:Piso0_002187 [Millerozyma farinosa CBS 7064]|uniref:Piso0_002187 protein n=1 Tax=Pichia sorbitophila (strain ATCC MYA-4447 / BCRC 22081 / CBS 7064 / NBRC 10061 / NRRL Y-12695) TaxID=559304 RepID=G8YBX9_PICSO|nr:Piso0_002187 [Millerozyma farinosa CBS 7064]